MKSASHRIWAGAGGFHSAVVLGLRPRHLPRWRASLSRMKSPLTRPLCATLSPRGEGWCPMEAEYAIAAGTPDSLSPCGRRTGVRGSFPAHFINLAALRHPISADLFIEKTVARHEGHPLAAARRPRLLALRRGGARACLPQAWRDARGAVRRWPRRSRLPPLSTIERGGAGCARPAACRGRAAKRRARYFRADGARQARTFILAGGSAAGVRHLSRNRPGRRRLGRDNFLPLLPAGGRRAPGRRFVRYTGVTPLTLPSPQWERGRAGSQHVEQASPLPWGEGG